MREKKGETQIRRKESKRESERGKERDRERETEHFININNNEALMFH